MVTKKPVVDRPTASLLPQKVCMLFSVQCPRSLTIFFIALFIWDYVITLDKEVRYVWGRKPTIATILFMVNRYVNLSATIFQLFTQATFQRLEVCELCIHIASLLNSVPEVSRPFLPVLFPQC